MNNNENSLRDKTDENKLNTVNLGGMIAWVLSYTSPLKMRFTRHVLSTLTNQKKFFSLLNCHVVTVTTIGSFWVCLQKTMSGDLVTSSQSAFDKAKRNALKHLNKDDHEADSIFGVCASVPEPVFFCSIEPPSMATQQALDQALIELQREDPSLRVSYNSETGQTVLAGNLSCTGCPNGRLKPLFL